MLLSTTGLQFKVKALDTSFGHDCKYTFIPLSNSIKSSLHVDIKNNRFREKIF